MANEQTTKRRQALAETEKRLVSTLPPLADSLEEFYATAPTSDGTESIELKIIRPKEGHSAPRQLVLLFHGGGFGAGSGEMLTRPGREIAEDFGAVVVLSSYRKAPEHTFPTPMLDGWHIANWVLQNPFGADPKRGFVVGGFSAGGQIAAVVAAQPDPGDNMHLSLPITGLFVGIPSLLSEDIVPEKYRHLWKSRVENTPNEFLKAEDLKAILETLKADTKSPWFSPFNSSTGLSKMPPTYIQVGEKDVLRDDGVVFEKALHDAGVPVKMDVHKGLEHSGFTIWAQGDDSPEDLKTKTMSGIGWLLAAE